MFDLVRKTYIGHVKGWFIVLYIEYFLVVNWNQKKKKIKIEEIKKKYFSSHMIN